VKGRTRGPAEVGDGPGLDDHASRDARPLAEADLGEQGLAVFARGSGDRREPRLRVGLQALGHDLVRQRQLDEVPDEHASIVPDRGHMEEGPWSRPGRGFRSAQKGDLEAHGGPVARAVDRERRADALGACTEVGEAAAFH